MAKHAIWDWNGTLLDDARYAVGVMNTITAECALPELDLERYRSIFGFPVRDYYDQLGFEEHHPDFETVATQFIERYEARVRECDLQVGARSTLEELSGRGVVQTLLSAAEQDSLRRQVVRHELDRYFSAVLGLDNHYAMGKMDIGKAWLDSSGTDPRECVLIGDTVHDFEVAQELGVACVLVCRGHQSKQRLQACSCPVVDSLSEVVARVWS